MMIESLTTPEEVRRPTIGERHAGFQLGVVIGDPYTHPLWSFVDIQKVSDSVTGAMTRRRQ